jgi:colanic acid/amylovoran biosynthesis glycosyltransferase
MRIVLYVPSFPKSSETFIVNQFLGLLESGYDVHVHCDRWQPGEAAKFRQLAGRRDWRSQVHVRWPCRPRVWAALLAPFAVLHCLIRNPRATARYVRHAWRTPGFRGWKQLYLDARLLSLRPQVVHFEFGSLAAGRMELKELLGCKVLVSFRGYDLNYVGLEEPAHYEAVWRRADALHFLGNDLWRRAQRRGCPAEASHVLIPPAIDSKFFAPGRREAAGRAGAAERPLRLLSVGRLEWKKGYEYVLQAVKLLKEQGVHCEYRIIGDGDHRVCLAFACRQLGLASDVELLRNCTSEQVKREMDWADVLVHGAVSEGFCNAVLEAQSMALPVVCTDADGLAENVADGETGFVVGRRNPHALAERLNELAENPALRRRMGRAGRDRVTERFQLPQQIEAFARAYRQLSSANGAQHHH